MTMNNVYPELFSRHPANPILTAAQWPYPVYSVFNPGATVLADGSTVSPDLTHWGGHKLMLPARRGAWWDTNKIGLAAPPIQTARGWLAIYHGVRQTAAGAIYRLGLALFDRDNPEHCLRRSDDWMFGPEAPYERRGDVDNVVFPCGYTLGPDGDTIRLYYGAADTCVVLATGSVRSLLAWLDEHSSSVEESVAVGD